MSSGRLPRDVSVQLNQRHVCIKCGERFVEFNNIGRLQCTQTYYLYGQRFTVAADHMAPDSSSGEQRCATDDELRDAWYLYVYDENNDFSVDARYYSMLPTPDERALVVAGCDDVDGSSSDSNDNNTSAAKYHMRRMLRTGADERLHPTLRRAMEMCDDSMDQSDSEEEEEEEDSDGDDNEAFFQNTTPLESFTRRYRIRRYDWRREADIMAREVEKARVAFEVRNIESGNMRVPIELTNYRFYREYVLRAFGFSI